MDGCHKIQKNILEALEKIITAHEVKFKKGDFCEVDFLSIQVNCALSYLLSILHKVAQNIEPPYTMHQVITPIIEAIVHETGGKIISAAELALLTKSHEAITH